jgi:hypothetical protein
MITDKFKRTIFDKLSEDLSHVEIISYHDSFWFINREKKYWYLEFKSSGELYWRWHFFIEFFELFTMERNQFEPIISEWVEKVLNHELITTEINIGNHVGIEEVLNGGVKTSYRANKDGFLVSYILKKSVTATISNHIRGLKCVEEILNNGTTI